MRRTQAPLGRLESSAQRYEGAYHLDVEAHMTHSSGEGLALDVDHHGRIGDHTTHSSCTGHAGHHVPHTSGAISGCEPTRLYLLRQIDCGSYSATKRQRNSGFPPPGAML